MEEQLTSLKQALRSLVVSSPTTMTVSSLLKDYRNMVGGVLPLNKFGYRDPITFLRERCNDVFVLEGPQRDPILTPKITENLKHIDQMVQKQRVQSGSRFKGKRRSVPGSFSVQTNMAPRYETRHRIYDTVPPIFRETNVVAPIQKVEPKIREVIKNNNQNEQQQNTRNQNENEKHQNMTNQYENERHQNTRNQNENEKYQNMSKQNDEKCQNISNQNGYKINQDNDTHNTTFNSNDKENENYNSVEEICPNSALRKFYKKRLPHYNSDMDFPSSETDCISKESPDSGRQSSSSHSSSKQARLEELKCDILALIKDSADGVWCTDLLKLYRERYGRELVYTGFGHTSIISLVYSMDSRVLITRPTPSGDWLLQDPYSESAPRSARGVRAGPAGPPRRAPRYLSQRDLPTDPDDALPGIDFEPDVFPADSLHYMDAIPAQPLEAVDGGMQFEVLIGEVYSPSHFWMLRVGPQYNLAMEHLMDEMTEYYRGEGAARQLARGAIRVGQYCASVFERDWHRSLIVCLVDSDTVKIRHVDYGTVDTVPVSSLKPLLRRWGSLPAQAIRARLAGLRPAAGGRRWPRAACAWLLHRVRDKRLYANVVAVDHEEDILETFLTDTSSAEDVCLTRELVRSGHADRRPDSALRRDEWYLYPRFEALESGATPNYADICRILADGIALDYVEAYRRHVPGPWTRAATPPPAPAPCDLPSPLELLNRVPLLRVSSPPPPPERAAPLLPAPSSGRRDQPAPALEVQVSEAEWAVLTHLRDLDPTAAHCYVMTAAWRAMQAPPPGF